MEKICKCCRNTVESEPVFSLKNMPAGAQDFLNESELENDKGIDIDLYQCPYCGLVQLFCEPVEYYKEVIRATSVSEEMRKFRIDQFTELSDKYNLKGKKVIEYGCGNGDYLSVFNDAVDCELYGLEYSDKNIDICKNKDLKVIKGYLNDFEQCLEEGPFDAFFIMNFMEHMPEPSVFLKKARENLSNDGIGLIEVPNCNMIFEKNLFSELISDHLIYFTKETLEELLNINGFEILESKIIWHDYILSAVVRKKNTLSGEGFEQNFNQMKSMFENFVNERKKFGEIAIWGAGHQALANIAVLGFYKDIKYIIDSADFKQNKYSPASHIFVTSPDVLKTGEIKSVIIMAGSYSEEVAKILRTNYPGVDGFILKEGVLEKV
ncbi:MAG: methyltransferase domain-containing protein [Lachnospiraceae bacterium]|nr:methyltransferase domain-containing protein [Lachnospiraceae bacterium]